MGKKRRKAGARPQSSAGQAVADAIERALDQLWVTIGNGDVFAAEQATSALLALPLLAEGTADEYDLVGRALIAAADRQPYGPERAAFLRLLMALGPRSVKREASAALADLTDDGVYPPEWVTSIAKPVPRQAYLGRDVYGDQETIVMTFGYGDAEHAIVVVIDRAELPTVIAVIPISDASRATKLLAGEFVTTLDPVTLAEARHRVETPLAQAGQDPDSLPGNSSALTLPLARSRVRRLPAPEPGAAVIYTAADRAAAVEEFLRSPLAAAAGDPGVARFWAQVLTGYSGRVPDEPPARVGPRTLTAMLLMYAARVFTLTEDQAGGLPAAATAWVRWAADRQGLDAAATGGLMTRLAKSLDDFQEAGEDPYFAESRRYVRELAAPDADAAWLADCLARREFAAPLPDDRDPAAATADATEEAGRFLLVVTEFATCTSRGQEAVSLLTGAGRVVEELWHDEPPSTWQAARQLLAEGHDRHEVIHLLAERSGTGGATVPI